MVDVHKTPRLVLFAWKIIEIRTTWSNHLFSFKSVRVVSMCVLVREIACRRSKMKRPQFRISGLLSTITSHFILEIYYPVAHLLFHWMSNCVWISVKDHFCYIWLSIRNSFTNFDCIWALILTQNKLIFLIIVKRSVISPFIIFQKWFVYT